MFLVFRMMNSTQCYKIVWNGGVLVIKQKRQLLKIYPRYSWFVISLEFHYQNGDKTPQKLLQERDELIVGEFDDALQVD